MGKNTSLSPTTAVEAKIIKYMESGRLQLPANYHYGNALRAAYLKLQEVVDKNYKPALEVCTRTSIEASLLKMAVMGLDVSRDQGYFIVYGKKLVFMSSYFGKEAIARRDADVKEVLPVLVFKGDKFDYDIIGGRICNVIHDPSPENIDESNIDYAYCYVYFNDKQRAPYIEVMTIKQIKNSWSHGKTPKAQKSDPGEMAKRTIIARALKRYIKASTSKFPELAEQDALEERVEKGEQPQVIGFEDIEQIPEATIIPENKKETPEHRTENPNPVINEPDQLIKEPNQDAGDSPFQGGFPLMPKEDL